MIAVGASFLIAAQATAAPVFLQCDIPQNGKPWPVNFVVDEESKQVAIIVANTGYVEQMVGTFLPHAVLAKTEVMTYEINRVDLTVIRKSRYLKEASRGVCKVGELPKRAF